MKHTKGPWNVEKVHYRHAVVDDAQSGEWKLIAETTSRENASLIAAAPEMLEALEVSIATMREIGLSIIKTSPASSKYLLEQAAIAETIAKKAKGEV